jgi:DNA-binding response OmpR family regulator
VKVLVAHESPTTREVIRHLLVDAGYQVVAVADGRAAVAALAERPEAMVLDVGLPDVLAFEVVEEARHRSSGTRIVLVASVYNRTSYKRRPTSLYGADDYIEQHHIPDALVTKIARLLGAPPPAHTVDPHADTPDGRAIRSENESRLAAVQADEARRVERAQRLARLIVADVALYNGDALDEHALTGNAAELEARLRHDLDEGRLLFDLRVPEELRRTRDFIGEALEEIKARHGQRQG